MSGVRLPVQQGTDAWLVARRGLVTATDIPVLLGLNPYKSEARLADEKRGDPTDPPNAAMRLGLAIESFVAIEYQSATGRRVRRVNHLLRHPDIEWAAASLDREVIGERRVVEIKSTASRRWEDGLPQDVQAQVMWQMGVGGYPVADVAAWVFGAKDPLRITTLEYDADLFAGLVDIATDFRRRLAAGGPFTPDLGYLRDKYPTDDGTEIAADADLTDAVRALVHVRGERKALEGKEEALESAIKTRMAEATRLVGEGFVCSWKRTKDRTETDWRAVATDLLTPLAEPERAALVGRHATVRAGFRPFRVSVGKEEPE
jgi:putative phage-type endonuclease